jgi:hypothetical protein
VSPKRAGAPIYSHSRGEHRIQTRLSCTGFKRCPNLVRRDGGRHLEVDPTWTRKEQKVAPKDAKFGTILLGSTILRAITPFR